MIGIKNGVGVTASLAGKGLGYRSIEEVVDVRTMVKRRSGELKAELNRLVTLQQLAREQAERLAPYLGDARDNAAEKLIVARGWTAPRVESAAHAVEERIAPKVAGLLTAAAQRIEPDRAQRGWLAMRRGGRRVPASAVVLGLVGGAVVAYGVVRLRRAAQNGEFDAQLEQARTTLSGTADSVKETTRAMRDKVQGAADRTSNTVKAGAGKGADKAESAVDDTVDTLNGRVRR
ncbi:hypothetical protein [Allonocardiopsis opalescens]|uniref:Uncharacterized protein n=1 Tax=Allonocardiopsis opalescens TaxID=1144618 RepID=A0A2T0Q705_9ACTN|nr:hypothetical protein [Allonocardiopsis opalescens]PRX99598.1 hypothetical protein CLV72_103201 [Allonocardiopsis opalescens]